MDWMIEFGWGILLTSFTGSLFFLVWRLGWRGPAWPERDSGC